MTVGEEGIGDNYGVLSSVPTRHVLTSSPAGDPPAAPLRQVHSLQRLTWVNVGLKYAADSKENNSLISH